MRSAPCFTLAIGLALAPAAQARPVTPFTVPAPITIPSGSKVGPQSLPGGSVLINNGTIDGGGSPAVTTTGNGIITITNNGAITTSTNGITTTKNGTTTTTSIITTGISVSGTSSTITNGGTIGVTSSSTVP